MANNKPYSNVTKRIAWPKDLRSNIRKMGKIKSSYGGLNSLEYVEWFQMLDGKPLRRVFAFAYEKRTYKKKVGKTYKIKPPKLCIREIARYYDHHQFLNEGLYVIPMAGKRVNFSLTYNNFSMWPKEHNTPCKYWEFWPTRHIQDYKQFLRENELYYTGWNSDIDMHFDEYLTLYLENPKIELLSKADMGYWIKYLRYLDTSKKTLHEIFKIPQECVPLLKDKRFNYEALMICRKTKESDINTILSYMNVGHIRKEYIESFKYRAEKPHAEILEILNAPKTYKYMSKLLSQKNFRSHDYIDYLKELETLGGLTDPKALYPKSFQKAHKEAYLRVKMAESAELLDGFKKSYKKYQKYAYENDSFLIRPVKEPGELFEESSKLDHCVRTYDKNVAAGTTEIMFIRKADKPDKPFYTLELKKKKVVQVRGKDNRDPSNDVSKFIEEWASNFNIQYSGKQNHYAYY